MILDLSLIVCLILGAVFHVTDLFGKKVSEDRIMNYIQQVREDTRGSNCSSFSSLGCRCRFAVMGSLFSFFSFF